MKTLYKSFFVALLMLFSTNAFAGGVVSVNSGNKVSFTPGKTASLDVYLTNTDEGITCMQFSLILPEGATIGASKSDMKIDFKRNLSSNYEVGIDGNTYSFYVESTSTVSGKEGLLFSMEVSFADDFEGGEGKFKDILIAGNEEDAPADVTFTFEKAATETVTIPISNEWNTYCCEKALDFEGVEGVVAYVVSSVTTTEANTTNVTQIPANEGFLIQKITADVTSIEVPVIASAAAVTNKLVGTTVEIPIAAENYVLSNGKFVKCLGGTLPANKAYLPKDEVPTSADAKGIAIVFDGNTTGINEVQKAETDGAIYNLSGMRVSKTQKGVYIMNGRKVIVK
ncbi:MAG: hypothetical protein IKX65_03145 [Prevotella sp.]|nr:hypothetical protein [Prevotella sp.]